MLQINCNYTNVLRVSTDTVSKNIPGYIIYYNERRNDNARWIVAVPIFCPEDKAIDNDDTGHRIDAAASPAIPTD